MPDTDVTIEAVFKVATGPNLYMTPSPLNFANVTFGYAAPAAQTITIHNSGNATANVTAIAVVSGSGYTLASNTVPRTIDAEDNSTFTVRPNTGLSAGTHNVTIRVTYDDGKYTEVHVHFTVNPAIIPSASITVVAPVRGNVPVTTAPAGGTGFTCSAVSWSPNDNPFGISTRYTATVTLTAQANYTFTGGIGTSFINGYTATLVSDTGTQVVLSYQFPPTDAGPLATWTAIEAGSAANQSQFSNTQNINNVAYVNGRFIAVGAANSMAQSTDGITWVKVTAPFSSNIRNITYINGRYIAVDNNAEIAYSADLITWTKASDSTFGTNQITGIAWNGSRYVAVGTFGRMAYSADLITWTAINDGTGPGESQFPSNRNINDIIYANGKFVAVGSNGVIAHSTDGINWTAVSNSNVNLNAINRITYGNGRYLAVTNGGRITHSTDGITWTGFASVFTTMNTYGGGLFFAGGVSGLMAHSATGLDLSWTRLENDVTTFGTSAAINGIAFGNNRFVAVGSNGNIAYSGTITP
jgi:methionine-rich copper-binding protein CopC